MEFIFWMLEKLLIALISIIIFMCIVVAVSFSFVKFVASMNYIIYLLNGYKNFKVV